ncbi:Nn.00g076780.m01.CDS01 [Neocucurbitaria sp. VM-36]
MDYVNRISDTRFNDPMDVEYTMRLLEHPEPTHIPLGEHRGVGYRLKPCPTTLRATLTPRKNGDVVVCTPLPHVFLGLNKTAPSSSHKVGGDSSKDSVLSGDHLSNATGFVFFQLGVLEYADYQQWSKRKNGLLPVDMAWEPTHYIVAVQINETWNGRLRIDCNQVLVAWECIENIYRSRRIEK